MVTEIGWILIPIGIILSFSKWIYFLWIFFIPFSATVVINIQKGDSWSGLQVSMFLGTLWFTIGFLRNIFDQNIRLPRERGLSFTLLLIFGILALASLITPLLIDGTVWIPVVGPDSWEENKIPLTLTNHHLTQFAYLAYGIISSIIVSINIRDFSDILNSIKTYIVSGVFVSIWAMYQWICYIFDFYYPSFIFNNSLSPSNYRFENIFENIPRIASVTLEPSYLANYLLTVIPFLFLAVIRKDYIFSRVVDILSLLIMLYALFISTSTSGYIGLAFMLISIFWIAYLFKINITKFIVFFIFIILISIILYNENEFVHKIIYYQVLTKDSSSSVALRLYRIRDSWDYFLRFPILGIGWGTLTSHDLVISLLSNTGILGFLSFATFIFYVLRRYFNVALRYTIAKVSDKEKGIFVALFIAYSTCLFGYIVGGFSFYLGIFWFLTGIIIGVTCYVIRKASLESIERLRI